MSKNPSTSPTVGENRLLAALPPAELARVLRNTEEVSMRLKDVLYRPNSRVEYVYFPRTGVAASVMVMQDGATVEVSTVGREGMVGLPALIDAAVGPVQVFCQVAGLARRMPVAAFRDEVRRDAGLADLLQRYLHASLATASQTAACNRLHSVEQRMARWLLVTRDRGDGEEVPLTQEMMSVMLGVRRPTVTGVASGLMKQEFIRYQRGKIVINDRAGLEKVSCECYRVAKGEFNRLMG